MSTNRLISVLPLLLLVSATSAFSTVEVSPTPRGSIVALVDGTTITWDASRGFHYVVMLAGNRTLQAPTGLVEGGDYTLTVYNDSAGSRLLTYDEAGFLFESGERPTLATVAYSRTILKFYSDGSKLIYVSKIANPIAVPNTPTNFVATDGVGVVSFSWQDNSSIETGYRVEQFDGLFWNAIGDDTAPNVHSVSNVPVDPGTYQFRVSALGNQNSDPSNQDSATSSTP